MERDLPETDLTRARVAWYYFIGGLTQQEIAKKLDLTRTRVNRIVGQLRAEGSVRVEIGLSLADCVALEDQLQRRYGLKSVRVVPRLDDELEQQRVIGEAAGNVLVGMLQNGMGLGVGWGRTLAAALPRLNNAPVSAAWVGTLMGGLTHGLGTTTFELATAFAKSLGSDCYYLAVPIHLPTPKSRSLLENLFEIAEVFQHLRTADIALVSCGDLSRRSQLANTKMVADSLDELKARGAVGDILGLYIDAEGEPVPHPLNECLMALKPDDLKRIPDTILASGGAHKAVVVGAVLNAGYINHLITDQSCAELLLKSAG